MFIPWIGLGRRQLALPSVEQRKARSCDFQRGRTPFQSVKISFAKKNIFIKRPNLTPARSDEYLGIKAIFYRLLCSPFDKEKPGCCNQVVS